MFLVATPDGAPTGILGFRPRISMFLVATPEGAPTEAFGPSPKAPCVAALRAQLSIHAASFGLGQCSLILDSD
ncbi:MAG: hypothetical protein ACI9K5_000752 [Gammaproteobacteria bacterium]|jgi:hypothetical protein